MARDRTHEIWEEIWKLPQPVHSSIKDINLDNVLSGVSNLFLLRLTVKLLKITADRTSAAMEVNQKLHI